MGWSFTTRCSPLGLIAHCFLALYSPLANCAHTPGAPPDPRRAALARTSVSSVPRFRQTIAAPVVELSSGGRNSLEMLDEESREDPAVHTAQGLVDALRTENWRFCNPGCCFSTARMEGGHSDHPPCHAPERLHSSSLRQTVTLQLERWQFGVASLDLAFTTPSDLRSFQAFNFRRSTRVIQEQPSPRSVKAWG